MLYKDRMKDKDLLGETSRQICGQNDVVRMIIITTVIFNKSYKSLSISRVEDYTDSCYVIA